MNIVPKSLFKPKDTKNTALSLKKKNTSSISWLVGSFSANSEDEFLNIITRFVKPKLSQVRKTFHMFSHKALVKRHLFKNPGLAAYF